tara:strand:+ start:505 stop:693 length:189 start_codon:yes stop_codon:yes gene_type:complete
MSDTVFSLLGRKLDEYEEDIKTYLASGQAEDLSAYNRLVGRCDLVKIIRQDLQDIEKRYIEN